MHLIPSWPVVLQLTRAQNLAVTNGGSGIPPISENKRTWPRGDTRARVRPAARLTHGGGHASSSFEMRGNGLADATIPLLPKSMNTAGGAERLFSVSYMKIIPSYLIPGFSWIGLRTLKIPHRVWTVEFHGFGSDLCWIPHQIYPSTAYFQNTQLSLSVSSLFRGLKTVQKLFLNSSSQ